MLLHDSVEQHHSNGIVPDQDSRIRLLTRQRKGEPKRTRSRASLTSFVSYQATLYPDFTTVPIPLSLSTVSAFEEYYLALPPPKSLPPTLSSPKPRAHIYVCTHGARDCRCADIGEPLYQALVKEARRRKLGGEMGDPSTEEGVLIARIVHVGGHVWAGNALVYREDGRSDW